MTRIRRRRGAVRDTLTDAETMYLLHGGGVGFLDPITRLRDLEDAFAAWATFGDELTADAASRGLTPWFAIEHFGAAGHSSRYCYLGASPCHGPNTPRLTKEETTTR